VSDELADVNPGSSPPLLGTHCGVPVVQNCRCAFSPPRRECAAQAMPVAMATLVEGREVASGDLASSGPMESAPKRICGP
jgi:hypothetical protein